MTNWNARNLTFPQIGVQLKFLAKVKEQQGIEHSLTS